MNREDLAAHVGRLSQLESRVLERFLHRRAVLAGRPPVEPGMTLGQRAADRIASFGGSWPFLFLFGAILLAWIAINVALRRPFDPYPYILLNLVLSCLAAIQAPVIMMSQNRQAEKDRSQAQLDYEVNLKAELEILALHEKIDLLREKAWADLVALQERQIDLLGRIEGSVGARS